MKTFYKTALQHNEIREKQIALENKTGVKWEGYSALGGTNFTPIVTKNTPVNSELAAKLLSFLTTDYEKFVTLSEISKMSLPDVLIAAKTLVTSRQAFGQINRMGNMAFIRSKHSWEK